MPALRCLTVRARSGRSTTGWLGAGRTRFACSLGRSGRKAIKREGDGATPVGTWRLVEVLYRADRVRRPRTRLPVRALRHGDGWCDAAGDRNYNRKVRHPYPASAEHLWRQDHVYDLVVIISHNRLPRVQGHGSAVFAHLARPGLLPTDGCVALSERDLRWLVERCDRRTRLVVAKP